MDPQDKSAGQPQPQNNSINNDGQSPEPATDLVSQSNSSVQQPDGSGDDKQGFTEVSLPAEAQDTDLIEKEWVERAKQIVEHTREDPYEQLRALSHMKADYLKKRYNKDIKISDD